MTQLERLEMYEKQRSMMKRCIDHKCPYVRAIAEGNYQYSKGGCFCDYISIAKHRRGCLPSECNHWKDEVIKDEKGKIHITDRSQEGGQNAQ